MKFQKVAVNDLSVGIKTDVKQTEIKKLWAASYNFSQK